MKFILSISIFCLLLALGFSSKAQYHDDVWILGGMKHLSDPFKEFKMDFQLDARSSSFKNEAVRIGGLRVGVEYRRVHRFGFGLDGLSNNLTFDQFEPIEQAHSKAYFDFSYATLYYERVLFFNPKWEFSSTVHLGRGDVRVSFRDALSEQVEVFETYKVGVAELSASGFYHLTYWLSLGGGLGYRLVNDQNEELANEYSSGFYVVKAKLRIGKLVRSIFNKDVKNEY